MDIARTREAKLEQQGVSVRTRDTNIVAIRQNPSPQGEKCGLTHGKNAQPKALGVGNVTSGIIGSKCAKINKHKIGEPNHHLESNLKPGNHRTRQVKARYM